MLYMMRRRRNVVGFMKEDPRLSASGQAITCEAATYYYIGSLALWEPVQLFRASRNCAQLEAWHELGLVRAENQKLH